MFSLLRVRKARRKLVANSRGFSSIVGAVFAVLVMISIISTVFVWSLSQNTLYNNAVTQTRQADLDRSNERIVANVTCLRLDPNTVSVNGTLENDGPLSAHIVTLWVADANNKNYNYTALNITLPSGNITTLSGSTALNVPIANSAGDSLICWFISGRGNTISMLSGANGGTTIINNYGGNETTTYANVSQGIGIIAFDFKAFSHCDYISKPAGNNIPLKNLSKTYTISQTNYTIFHVTLTNFDPSEQNMTINAASAIYLLGIHSGTVKYALWNLVNVTGNATTGYLLNPSFTAVYNLPPYTPVDIFFAGTVVAPYVDSTVYPLNIMLIGKLGAGDYGQNVPFVSLNVI